jgi:ribosomal protein S18 acetylase RimI-like enzyme
MLIRPFEVPDTDAVIALWHVCGLTRPANDPAEDISQKLTTQPELFLVATDADGIVGSAMAGYDGHRGWVNYLAVAPDFRGRGHAAALMGEVERLLAGLGCAKLNLQIRTSNAGVIAMYQHLGYSQDAVVSYGKRLRPRPTPPGLADGLPAAL